MVFEEESCVYLKWEAQARPNQPRLRPLMTPVRAGLKRLKPRCTRQRAQLPPARPPTAKALDVEIHLFHTQAQVGRSQPAGTPSVLQAAVTAERIRLTSSSRATRTRHCHSSS